MNEVNFARVFVLDYGKGFNIEEFFPFFSEERMRKIEACRIKSMCEQLAAAEITICAAMKSMGQDHAPPQYWYDPNGMPCMYGGYISITHTKGIAACAISNHSIGIDIERVRTISGTLAGRILCAEELAEYSCAADADNFVLQAWTAKESVLKLTGEGLGGGMRNYYYDRNQSCVHARNHNVKYSVDISVLTVSECPGFCGERNHNAALLAVCTEFEQSFKLHIANSPYDWLQRPSSYNGTFV